MGLSTGGLWPRNGTDWVGYYGWDSGNDGVSAGEWPGGAGNKRDAIMRRAAWRFQPFSMGMPSFSTV